MKLYDGGRAPNPRRTRIFLAEKGIELPMEQVDLGALAHKSEVYAAVKNPETRLRRSIFARESQDSSILSISRTVRSSSKAISCS